MGRFFAGEQLEQLGGGLVLGRQQLRRREDVFEELDGQILETAVGFKVIAMFGDPVAQDAENAHGGRRRHDALFAVDAAFLRKSLTSAYACIIQWISKKNFNFKKNFQLKKKFSIKKKISIKKNTIF